MKSLILILLACLTFSSVSDAADLYTFFDDDGNAFYTNIPGEGRINVSLRSGAMPANKEVYKSVIAAAGQRSNIDPDLLRAIIKAESNFNPRAVSPKGAMGLMQLMPETAQKMAVANPFNPEENIRGGVRYLDELLQLLDGNLPLALAAYNAGPSRVIGKNEIPLIEETQEYVRRVMTYYKDLNRNHK